MTVKEFSSEFDVLYNSITSNQAPSLDEYEKSVFLTKAQEELVRAYFNKSLNKIQEGFGDGIYRDAFFHTLIRHASTELRYIDPDDNSDGSFNIETSPKYPATTHVQQKENPYEYEIRLDGLCLELNSDYCRPSYEENFNPNDILFIIQDWVQIFDVDIFEGEGTYTLKRTYPVIPITPAERQLAQSRSYPYPPKRQIWRLLEYNDPTFVLNEGDVVDSHYCKFVYLIFGPNKFDPDHNEGLIYHLKFIKNPYPIILSSDLSSIEKGLTIRGKKTYLDETNPCELPEAFHKDILQRAVELAKAVYQGDINSTISVGQISGTELGVTTTNTREQ